jgi:hypothetical protein
LLTLNLAVHTTRGEIKEYGNIMADANFFKMRSAF